MEINFFGLAFMAVIMIPNIIFAVRCRDGFANAWHCKTVELLEQIGRFGCFIFMAVNIKGVTFGFPSEEIFVLYLFVNAVLVGAYCLIWAVCFCKNSRFRALALSILPSAVFLFSGLASRSVLLTAAAVLFAPCHIVISFKNASAALTGGQPEENEKKDAGD